VAEGAGATFTVTLSAVSGQQVTVDYASVTGTATAADFNAVANTLDFAPGETTKAIPVATNDDALDEDTENYTIALSAASNATIADDLGFGTIIDNDAPPTLSISDVILIEGRRAQSPRT
jgi:hypothetical protein